MSIKREKLNALLGEDELDDAQRGEMGALTTRMQELEVEARGAIMAEGEPTITTTTVMDDEGRELRSLRANVGAIFEAVIEHRSTGGAKADLQTHFGLAANAIPMAAVGNSCCNASTE